MKTAEERAQDLLSTITGLKREDKLKYIILALKDQDKITRHACAENATDIYTDIEEDIVCGYVTYKQVIDMIFSAVMNTKAV